MTFSAVPEIEKNKSVEAGWPIILQCEISDPTALVQWYKDGLQLLPQSGVYIKSQHTMRTLVIQSANVSHSGFYSCNAADDISEFFVDVKGDIQTLSKVFCYKTNKYIDFVEFSFHWVKAFFSTFQQIHSAAFMGSLTISLMQEYF